MGSSSWVTLLRRALADVCHKDAAVIEALRKDNRRLVSDLSEVTAERDGLRITCRLQGAALDAAAGRNSELSKKCRRLEEDAEGMRTFLRRHENPNSPTSSRAICHRERDKLRAVIGSYNDGGGGGAGGAVASPGAAAGSSGRGAPTPTSPSHRPPRCRGAHARGP